MEVALRLSGPAASGPGPAPAPQGPAPGRSGGTNTSRMSSSSQPNRARRSGVVGALLASSRATVLCPTQRSWAISSPARDIASSLLALPSLHLHGVEAAEAGAAEGLGLEQGLGVGLRERERVVLHVDDEVIAVTTPEEEQLLHDILTGVG